MTCHITEDELRCEAALEALVHRLKTFTLLQSTTKHGEMFTEDKAFWRGEKSLLSGACKKKKGKLSLCYMVYSTFPSESH
jgi:hypothetical protein